ncbi:Nucleoside diphosphate kinase 6 [Desmophyllum pertusum]|uniref:Nucleoside diphosphate kinase 6 n=1 Tax=Desmophyllum pertusum TaxID=174260 RepID=A0A9X0A1G3_9CNID|nr:Nucleoside diphosphate kinase 6 [Desmophyllum pertusum]
MGRSRLQLTLALLKPDLMMHPVRTKEVKTIIKDNGFLVIQSRVTAINQREAEKFYEEHRERFFFTRLTGYISSGPMTAMVLAKENSIAHWRDLMGPTKTYRARDIAPTSIRALYGISDTRNATHGSDSDESAKKEINFFFPEFNCDNWFETHEVLYRENRHTVVWDDNQGLT